MNATSILSSSCRRFALVVMTIAIGASACTTADEDDADVAVETEQNDGGAETAEADGVDGEETADGSADGTSAATDDDQADGTASPDLPQSVPEPFHGDWRMNDGTPVADDACRQDIEDNVGRVVSIRADGFNVFEEGGRLIEVHQRTNSLVEATFDTSYADEEVQSRILFALQEDGSIKVESADGNFFTETLRLVTCPA